MAQVSWPRKPDRPRRDVQPVDQPNLMRDMFPYDQPPRVLFDGVSVPISPAPEIFITDTTFRDGQQARPPFSVAQIVHLFDLLHQLGGPHGLIRQSEFFVYTKRDRAAVEACRERGYSYPEVTGWIRANEKDLQLVRAMGLTETGILTSCSDYHIFLKLGWNRQRALDRYLAVVQAALEAGIRPRCHFEDITRADIEGFVIPFAQRLMELQEQSGIPVKIRLCDTMGFGVPYPEAALPRSVPRLAYVLQREAGVPGSQLEWHGHNDFYNVMINPVTGWLYGIAGANGTLLGIGERTGNTPIEGLIFEQASLTGSLNGADPTVITRIAEYMEESCGVKIPASQPLVGRHFNATAAGVHVDGLLKNPEIYTPFDTERLLGRGIEVEVTDKSGLAGVAWWLEHHLPLPAGEHYGKDHPLVRALYDWVQEEFSQGRTVPLTDVELLAQTERFSEFTRSSEQNRHSA